MKAYDDITSVAQIIMTSEGHPITWITSDGAAKKEGELLGENTAASEGAVTFGTVSLGAKNYYQNN